MTSPDGTGPPTVELTADLDSHFEVDRPIEAERHVPPRADHSLGLEQVPREAAALRHYARLLALSRREPMEGPPTRRGNLPK